MRVDPYLYFQGRCEEALEFYRRSIGAEVQAMVRFGDMPGSQSPPGDRDKVMHAALRIGETTVLASDGQNRGTTRFEGFGLALSASTDAEAERLFAGLAEGGQVQMPLAPAPFASRYGLVADRFGVPWMIVCQTQPA